MTRCLISMEDCTSGEYSAKSLRQLHPKLRNLKVLAFSQSQQMEITREQVNKISIQGVQPKYSARLNLSTESFEVIQRQGTFIMKPQNPDWAEFPENEAFTMHMAKSFGIDAPLSGLIRCSDGSLSYFIKRFDRRARNKKLHVEDLSQLAQLDRKTKYNYSIEKIIKLINDYCTFPKIELVKFFKILIFNFCFGNEDMHLKNYSIITNSKGIIQLSPAYDLLNTVAVYRFYKRDFNNIEQSALSINGKKNKLKSHDFYSVAKKMELQPKVIEKSFHDLGKVLEAAEVSLNNSFMSNKMKTLYLEVLKTHSKIFFS
jgi:serine/threonine-protein kinase HipA